MEEIEINTKEMVNKKIAEKNLAKEKYDRKIGDIKVKRGINFSIEYLKSEKINSIMFTNLEYKNKAKKITLYYNAERNKFNAVTYEVSKNITIQDLRDTTLIKKLEKEYKLQVVIEEIEKANLEYIRSLDAIDRKYIQIEKEPLVSEKELEIKKNNE